MSQHTVFACRQDMLGRLFKASRSAWRASAGSAYLSNVHLLIGPSLAPAGASIDGASWIAFAFELESSTGETAYASEGLWGVAARLSTSVVELDYLTGEGDSTRVSLGSMTFGTGGQVDADIRLERLRRMSPEWEYDLSALHGFGQFGRSPARLSGARHRLDQEWVSPEHLLRDERKPRSESPAPRNAPADDRQWRAHPSGLWVLNSRATSRLPQDHNRRALHQSTRRLARPVA